MSQFLQKRNSIVLFRLVACLAVCLIGAGCNTPVAGTDALSGNPSRSADSAGTPIHPQASSSLCLDVAGGATTNGTAVQIAQCNGDAAQAWTFSNSNLRVFGNKCLDVTNGSTAGGTHLQIWDCSANDTNQMWSRSGQTLTWNGTALCMDLPYGAASDGTYVQVAACTAGDTAQQWNFTTSDGASAPTTAVAGPYTHLVWSDEFNGSTLDSTKWTPEVTCAPQNNEQECYTSDAQNVHLDGQGNLALTVQKKAGLSNGKSYTSARLNTQGKGDWHYGRFEMRAQMPAGQGFWPAFWMMPSDSVYGIWPTSGELDITEVLGGAPKVNYGSAHYGVQSPYTESQGITQNVDLSQGFHVYALERDTHQIRWYLDGQLFYTLNDQDTHFWPAGYTAPDGAKWPFNQNFYIILNVAMGGDWPGVPNPNIQTGALLVDYVRVYQ